MAELGWIDKFARSVSPRWALQRMRSRMAVDMLARHYEAASTGRRTQGWRRTSGDANAVIGGAISRLRDHARDLVRNNAHAASAVSTVADHTVGWGIVPMQAPSWWDEWANTTACDADGRNDFSGLEKLAMRTVAESGEVLVRRRFRRPEDDLPLPIQLQVLEGDYIDTLKTGIGLPNGGRIIQGVEFDSIGRRAAYWLFPEHPGSDQFFAGPSQRVPAESILHIFRQTRPGQVRGVSWFAPVILRLKDFDEYADAQLMKQKIAACLSIILTDVDGTAGGLGVVQAGEESTQPEWDQLGPGAVITGPPGRDVTVVQPPRVGDYGAYSEVTLREVATGFGVTYEDLTGDYSEMPFSAARMSRLRHWARVEDWRWQTLIPQFCVPAWSWAAQVAMIFGKARDVSAPEWTAPPPPMIDPVQEGLAFQRNVRSGAKSLSEALRELGYNPKTVLTELSNDFKLLDKLGLILDCDPRRMTQAGQFQSTAEATDEAEESRPTNGKPPVPPPKANGKAAANGATK